MTQTHWEYKTQKQRWGHVFKSNIPFNLEFLPTVLFLHGISHRESGRYTVWAPPLPPCSVLGILLIKLALLKVAHFFSRSSVSLLMLLAQATYLDYQTHRKEIWRWTQINPETHLAYCQHNSTLIGLLHLYKYRWDVLHLCLQMTSPQLHLKVTFCTIGIQNQLLVYWHFVDILQRVGALRLMVSKPITANNPTKGQLQSVLRNYNNVNLTLLLFKHCSNTSHDTHWLRKWFLTD